MFNPAKSIENLMNNESARKWISFGLMWIYLWVVLVLRTFENGKSMTMLLFALLFLLGAGLAFLLLKLLGKLPNFDTEPPKNPIKMLPFVLTIFCITFAFYMFYFGVQYPGGLSPDSINQYGQALNGIYNNWHPVLHTVLFFTLPLKSGHSLGLMIFLQLLYFCVAFTYLTWVLYRNGCPKFLLAIIYVYTWVNPYLATIMMYPWKDCAFTIFAVLLTAFHIQIICSDGEWLNKKKNILAFSFLASLCNYMRHNAVLFVAPLVIIVLIHGAKDKAGRLLMVGSIVLFFLIVQGLYKNLDVKAPGNRTVETVGLPATVLCNVMQKKPEALPESTRELMYQMATKEAYEKNYSTGNFNSIKWSKKFDAGKLDKLSYREILKYTWQCFRFAPKESFEALAKLTSVVWYPSGRDWPNKVYIEENDWGIKENPKFFGTLLRRIELRLRAMAGKNLPASPGAVDGNNNTEQNTKNPKSEISFLRRIKVPLMFAVNCAKLFFGSLGFANLMMLAVGLIMLARGHLTIVHFFPLFCYNFGTMLLLSGRDYRFFLLNLPLWIPVIFLMYKDRSL